MTKSVIDMATFEELRQASGADFIGELADTFLEDAPQLLQQIELALQAQDYEACRRAAHSLKSNSATFGATVLSEQSREIERLAKDKQLDLVGARLEQLQKTYSTVAAELKDLRS